MELLERLPVLSDEARLLIRRLIQEHTARNTVSAEAARESLVRRGIYNTQGELMPEYGGGEAAETDERDH